MFQKLKLIGNRELNQLIIIVTCIKGGKSEFNKGSYLEWNVSKPLNPVILLLEANDLPEAINSNFEGASRFQVWLLRLIRIASNRLLQLLIASPFSPKLIDSLHKYTYKITKPKDYQPKRFKAL